MERQVATPNQVARLAEPIRGSRSTVVLAGAGVSVPESAMARARELGEVDAELGALLGELAA